MGGLLAGLPASPAVRDSYHAFVEAALAGAAVRRRAGTACGGGRAAAALGSHLTAAPPTPACKSVPPHTVCMALPLS